MSRRGGEQLNQRQFHLQQMELQQQRSGNRFQRRDEPPPQRNERRREEPQSDSEEEQGNNNNSNNNDDDDDEYSDAHKLLMLQFINRKIIGRATLEKMIHLLNRQHQLNYTEVQYVNCINSRIMDTGLQIKTLNSDGVTDYVLVNIIPDECSKHASSYDPQKLQFFNSIIKLFVELKVGLKKNDILNLGKDINIRLTEAENTLTTFMEDGWLRYSVTRAFITLSNRGLLDLEPLLEEIPRCTLCHSTCVLLEDESVQCPKEDCAKMHLHCAEIWLKTNRGKCPTCQTVIN